LNWLELGEHLPVETARKCGFALCAIVVAVGCGWCVMCGSKMIGFALCATADS